MKRIKSILLVTLCLLVAVAALGGCSKKNEAAASTLDSIKKAGKLVVLTNAEFPPYEYLGENSEVTGIDVEMSQAIADALGVELEVVNMDFDGLIPALLGGKGDMVAAGMTVTDERLESVDFSDTYAEAKQLIIVSKDDPKVSGEDDLDGKIIGVQLGTTGDIYVDENVDAAELKQYKSGLEASVDLNNGKLDAIVIDKLPAESIANANSALTTIEMTGADDEEYAIAVKKGDTAFLEEINKIINELVSSGKMAEFAEKHIEAFSS